MDARILMLKLTLIIILISVGKILFFFLIHNLFDNAKKGMHGVDTALSHKTY
jgi:hypothetical protein